MPAVPQLGPTVPPAAVPSPAQGGLDPATRGGVLKAKATAEMVFLASWSHCRWKKAVNTCWTRRPRGVRPFRFLAKTCVFHLCPALQLPCSFTLFFAVRRALWAQQSAHDAV